MQKYLDIAHDDYLSVIRAIHSLPIKSETTCPNCRTTFQYLTMYVYAQCPQCSCSFKTRCFSAANEPQDFIGAVLAWLGKAEPADLEELIANSKKWFDEELLDNNTESS